MLVHYIVILNKSIVQNWFFIAQIDQELQDVTPPHNSPLSSLFSDPNKMKIWLVFIDSTEDIQDEMYVHCHT